MKNSEIKFNFRTDDTGFKRPTASLQVPVLELEDVLGICESGGKQVELLLEACNNVIYSHVRDLMGDAIDANPNVELNQGWLDSVIAQATWDAIANLPAAQRGQQGIAKETWAAFEQDYVATMATLHPERQVDRIKLAAKYLRTKFSSIKSDKKGISLLLSMLAEWFSNTAKAEDFAEVFTAINSRGEELLNKEVSAVDLLA